MLPGGGYKPFDRKTHGIFRREKKEAPTPVEVWALSRGGKAMTAYVVMALAALAGGIIQPLTGFGSAVILMVAAQYFFDITVAPSVAAAICVVQSGIMAWSRRRSIDLKQILPPIALYTVCSLVVISLLGKMDLHVLTAVFGGFLVLLAAYFLFIAKRVQLRPSPAAGMLCSAFSGCCAGAFTIGGPMMALYFVAIARDKESYVANMQFLFVTTNAINLAMRAWRGLYGAEYLPITAVGAVFVVLGMVIGNALSRRMSGDVARQVVYIGVGVSGLVTLLQQIL